LIVIVNVGLFLWISKVYGVISIAYGKDKSRITTRISKDGRWTKNAIGKTGGFYTEHARDVPSFIHRQG